MLKYGTDDLRPILERASARETAARVAAGGVAKALLRRFGVEIRSHVVRIGPEAVPLRDDLALADFEGVDESPVRCLDPEASARMVRPSRRPARTTTPSAASSRSGPSTRSPASARTSAATRASTAGSPRRSWAIQAIKGVEIGDGFELGRMPGSEAHDEIFHDPERGYFRQTNRAGGIEGGMTHGAPLVVRAAMKPISTLTRPLRSVDIATKEADQGLQGAHRLCAVPAAAVVAEAAVAFVLAQALLEKFGGDPIDDLDAAVERYRVEIAQ